MISCKRKVKVSRSKSHTTSPKGAESIQQASSPRSSGRPSCDGTLIWSFACLGNMCLVSKRIWINVGSRACFGELFTVPKMSYPGTVARMTKLASRASSWVMMETKLSRLSVILTKKGSDGRVDSGLLSVANSMPNSAPIGISVTPSASSMRTSIWFNPKSVLCKDSFKKIYAARLLPLQLTKVDERGAATWSGTIKVRRSPE